jgi:hypothetical protein
VPNFALRFVSLLRRRVCLFASTAVDTPPNVDHRKRRYLGKAKSNAIKIRCREWSRCADRRAAERGLGNFQKFKGAKIHLIDDRNF